MVCMKRIAQLGLYVIVDRDSKVVVIKLVGVMLGFESLDFGIPLVHCGLTLKAAASM